MKLNWKWTLGLGLATAVAAGFGAPSAVTAQQSAAAGAPQVTYTKDIAPILQRGWVSNLSKPSPAPTARTGPDLGS